jgi:putative two-component system response regulator
MIEKTWKTEEEMDEKHSILIVDDDESTLKTLALIFDKKGYETETALTGREAIEKAREKFFNLALLDIKLSDMEGVELLAPLKKMNPNMVVIIITGYASLETAVRALNEGAAAYITKPLNMDAVLATVKEGLEKQRLVTENERLYQEAQRELAERKRAEREIQRNLEKVRRAMEGTIRAMACIVETRDPYTAGHQQRVTHLACTIAKEMGLSEEQIEGIRMAGLIHDLGKIGLPAEILSKPGQINEPELNLVKTHPEVGHNMLKAIDFPWPVDQIVLQHHERMDGSGYPLGFTGAEILLEARILAVADVVEAIASHRPYRPALGFKKALQEISRNSGILYDSEVVNVCLRLFIEEGFRFEQEPEITHLANTQLRELSKR